MATIPLTIEQLEAIFQTPMAERMSDHYAYLYAGAVTLEGGAARPAELVRILLFKARVLADMEPKDYSAVVGEPRTGHQAVEAAFAVTTRALAIAASLGDALAEGRIQLLRGQLLRRLGDFPAAAVAYRASTILLARAVGTFGAVDPTIARELLDATIKLVSMEFQLGNFVAAQQALEHEVGIAQRLINGGGQAPVDVETVEWLRALLWRAQGESLRAFPSATMAADAYLRRKEPCISLVRVLWVATELALDLVAETTSLRDPTRKVYVSAARRYLGLTEQYAERVKDPAGMEMAKLSEARLRQLEHPASTVPVNRVRAVLEKVLKERGWDAPLLVDVYITLGRLLASRKLPTEAREAFGQAVRLAEEQGSPGMAWYAKGAMGAI